MRWHILALIILSLALAYLLNFVTEEPVAFSRANSTSEQDYDFFMTNVDSTQFNLAGVSEYRIKALRSTHYPNPDYTVLEQADFIIYQAGKPPWFISSDSAKIEKDVDLDQDKVELTGNVVIEHISTQERKIIIYTEALTVYPSSKRLSTELAVRIESQGTDISSTGMSADINLNTIKLLAEVRGRYYE